MYTAHRRSQGVHMHPQGENNKNGAYGNLEG